MINLLHITARNFERVHHVKLFPSVGMAVRLASQGLWNNFRKIDSNYLQKNYFLFRKIDTVQKINHAKYWRGRSSNYFSKKIFNRVSSVAGVTSLICVSYYRYVYDDTFNNIPNVLVAKEKGFPQFKISRSVCK